jgi:predicted O-linked N-acetylglucosamine transferase (SPINDLY family)
MPLVYSEEDHRTAYLLADVCLDSYPYNGGSQNLEALWFNLPVVTLVGEQSFARMGYSFLQTLSIEAGIAYNWEEYVEWGIKFGLDRELRQSVRSHLVQSKQSETLSPLWNPSQLARDMYAIFEKLLAVNHP